MGSLIRIFLPVLAFVGGALSGADRALAADLSGFEAGSPRGSFSGLHPEALFTGPARFDVYGHPVFGPVFTVEPSPLYAATGCPAALQPVYDPVGNFAGYSPIQLCR